MSEERAKLDQAANAFNQGQYQTSLSLAEAISPGSPEYPLAQRISGLALLEMGQVQALAQFRALNHADPGIGENWFWQGEAERKFGEFAQALDSYQKAFDLGYHAGFCWHKRALAFQSLGQRAEALRCFERAIDFLPDDHHLRFNFANLLAAAGDWSGAETQYQAACERAPDFASAHRGWGDACWALGRMDQAWEHYQLAHQLIRSINASISHESPDLVVECGFDRCSQVKLQHDIEQFRHLRKMAPKAQDWEDLIHRWQSVWTDLPPLPMDRTVLFTLTPAQQKTLGPAYKRALHIPSIPRLEGGAINPALDFAGITQSYQKADPKLGWFDDFLTPEALHQLRRFCLEATIWHDSDFENGYLGARVRDGFNCPLLLQIAEELSQKFPGIIDGAPLSTMWGFKYYGRQQGIAPHGDDAKVNFNFWITEDEALLDKSAGGMRVFTHAAPKDWRFSEFNGRANKAREFLDQHHSPEVVVPYAANRAVVFQSDLFHQTDRLAFKDRYQDRRISITLLFGER